MDEQDLRSIPGINADDWEQTPVSVRKVMAQLVLKVEQLDQRLKELEIENQQLREKVNRHKDIAGLIKDVFDGQVAEFLTENSLIITKTMQSQLKQLLTRLSPTEQQIVLQLSKIEKPVFREELKETSDLSSIKFINGLQSLQKRYLVIKTKDAKALFDLSSVFREYVRNYCKDCS